MYINLFRKSIDVLLNPDGEIINNLDMNNISGSISINYNNVTALNNFLNTNDGKIIIDKALKSEIHLNIFPIDSIGVNSNEIDFLISNRDLFSKPNVTFYQSWIIKEINYNLYFGSHIHKALSYLIEEAEKIDVDCLNSKEKYFLTLNNLFRPNRKELFDYYNSLSIEEKDKFLCSFNFEKKYLESIFVINNNGFSMFSNNVTQFYDLCFFEIVAESSFISITEKSFKPLLFGIPFIYWGISIQEFPQMDYFDYLGIDINYFNINYNNIENVKNKIKEILNTPREDLLTKYEYAFEKAKLNRIKILKYIKDIENKLIR